MDRSRALLMTIAGVVFLTSALPIVRHLTRAADIWWTPKELGPPLTEVADRVEVYVRDGWLDEHVRAGRLQLVGQAGPTPVTAGEVRFRFNNRDRVRAQEIPGLLVSAALLGAALATLLYGVVGARSARRRG